MEQDYNNLSFANDFMFAKVMRNADLCKKLLEVILNVEIEKIEYPEEQKVIDIAKNAKSVRLDVYVQDGQSTIYNVEMQATHTKNISKRSRYYQDMIDLNLIKKGQSYNVLNKSYVIFICMSDIFGKGRHIYTFENVCLQDKELPLGDETIKVFLNPYSDMDDVDDELNNFLKYLADGTVSDAFTKNLEQEVLKVKKNEEWRREYMTLYMKEQEAREEGLAQGRAEAEQAVKQMAINFIKLGKVSLEEIADATGLPLETVKELQVHTTGR
jgi:predicted transposase/invertase (TIGR01784 family)